MLFDPDKPLPLLPPKAELETKAVLRKAIAANKALAELKGAGELIPNQHADSRHRTARGKLSSEIENVVNHETMRIGGSRCSRNEHLLRTCRKNPGF
jgi:hypothetical protein